jgi:hypothetical protein
MFMPIRRWVAFFTSISDVKKSDVNGMWEAGTEEGKSLVVGLFLNAQTMLRSVVRLDIGRETR